MEVLSMAPTQKHRPTAGPWPRRAALLAAIPVVAGLLAGCMDLTPPPPASTQAEVLALLEAAETDDATRDELIEAGVNTFARMSCGTCHGFTAVPMTGPRLDRLYERPLQLVNPDAPTDPKQTTKATRDRPYLWRSIATPQADLVFGYSGAQRMTNFGHLMNNQDVAGLIAYLESKTRKPETQEE